MSAFRALTADVWACVAVGLAARCTLGDFGSGLAARPCFCWPRPACLIRMKRAQGSLLYLAGKMWSLR